MRITANDITSSRLWAENQRDSTEDDVLDLMEWKLLSLVQKSHVDSAGYHERNAHDIDKRMEEIASRFKVTDADF